MNQIPQAMVPWEHWLKRDRCCKPEETSELEIQPSPEIRRGNTDDDTDDDTEDDIGDDTDDDTDYDTEDDTDDDTMDTLTRRRSGCLSFL